MEPSRNGTAVTHLFRYDDQAGLHRFLENRLGPLTRPERVNASPPMPLALSPKVEERFRRKCAHEFDLFTSIGEDGAYTCPPAAPAPQQ